MQFLQHNKYACGRSEPFFNAFGAIESITSLEITMGLTPTSFRTKKYKFWEYNWFRGIFNVQSSNLNCKTFKLRIGRHLT